jgi:hypothetical protein
MKSPMTQHLKRKCHADMLKMYQFWKRRFTLLWSTDLLQWIQAIPTLKEVIIREHMRDQKGPIGTIEIMPGTLNIARITGIDRGTAKMAGTSL